MASNALSHSDGDPGMVSGSGASSGMSTLNEADKTSPNQVAAEVQAVGRLNTMDQHVFTHQFRVDAIDWATTDPVGKILRIYEMHPKNHPYTRLLYQNYLYWAGTFKDTFQVNGTGLCGGKLRILKVPPHITNDQLNSMTIDQLSFFDAVDVDPKILAAITIGYDDINTERAHRRDAKPDEPNYCGSRLVVVVWAKLQSAMETSQMINIVVQRSVVDFTWSTFVPTIASGPSIQYPVYPLENNFAFGKQLQRIDVGPSTAVKSVVYPMGTWPGAFNSRDPDITPVETIVKVPFKVTTKDQIQPVMLPHKYWDGLVFAYVEGTKINTNLTAAWNIQSGTARFDTTIDVGDHVMVFVLVESAVPDESVYNFESQNSERIIKFNFDTSKENVAMTGGLANFRRSWNENESTPIGPGQCEIYEFYNMHTHVVDGYFKLYPSGDWTAAKGKSGDAGLNLSVKDHALRYYSSGPSSMNIPENAITYRNMLLMDEISQMEARRRRRITRANRET